MSADRIGTTTDIEARLREYTSGDLIAADGFVGGDVLGTLREAADTIAALKAQLTEARHIIDWVRPQFLPGHVHAMIAKYDRAAEVLRKMEKANG